MRCSYDHRSGILDRDKGGGIDEPDRTDCTFNTDWDSGLCREGFTMCCEMWGPKHTLSRLGSSQSDTYS